MLGSFNNWNIVQSTNKTTPSEDFDELYKAVLGGISENMPSLVSNQNGILCDKIAIWSIPTTRRPKHSGHVIEEDELASKSEYLIIMK